MIEDGTRRGFFLFRSVPSNLTRTHPFFPIPFAKEWATTNAFSPFPLLRWSPFKKKAWFFFFSPQSHGK